MFPAKDPVPRDFVEFVRKNPSCWVKLTGVYRSDYPHLSFGHVHTAELFGLLKTWAPNESVRHKILVDNPARCFGF
jgi:predicted TIM-barrel fold metal-dependent hydrolase